MITKKMLQTLKEIRIQEDNKGVALAPEITVYQHRTTLYRALEKLIEINAIERQKAPQIIQAEHTYTTTSFGKKLIDNTQTQQKE